MKFLSFFLFLCFTKCPKDNVSALGVSRSSQVSTGQWLHPSSGFHELSKAGTTAAPHFWLLEPQVHWVPRAGSAPPVSLTRAQLGHKFASAEDSAEFWHNLHSCFPSRLKLECPWACCLRSSLCLGSSLPRLLPPLLPWSLRCRS